MNKISFSDLGSTDVNIFGISCIKQHWNNNDMYSYLKIPRKNSAVMLTLYCSMHYVFSDGRELKVPKNSVVVLSENSRYSVRMELTEPHPVSSIIINFNMTDQSFNPVTFAASDIILYKSVTQDITESFFAIADTYINSSKNVMSLKSRLYSLLNRLMLSCGRQSPEIGADNSVFTAIQYIENHLNEQIRLPKLAKLCAVSEATLRRNFKAVTGMSPIDYMNKLKIRKSKELLKFPEMSVNSLCEQLNFYDVSYLYRLFKRETGLTPIQYKKKHTEHF